MFNGLNVYNNTYNNVSRDTNSKIHFNLIAIMYNRGITIYNNITTKQVYKQYFKQ